MEARPVDSTASIEATLKEIKKKNYTAAELALAPALKSEPENPNILNIQGAILTNQGKYEAALQCYQQALAIDSQFFPAIYNRGDLLSKQHQWDAAIDYFKKLHREQPKRELVEYKLLILLLGQDVELPLQATLLSADLPSNTPAWYYAMAARAYKKGDATQAKKYLEVVNSLYADKIDIFQEELEGSGLLPSKK